jgi:hypothetical protein
MVEIFKTNIKNRKAARQLLSSLSATFPDLKINVDVEDCDKILRVEGQTIAAHKVIDFMIASGYQCEKLPD